ncbi:MAG TPA: RHS repeat-associated core domain-containing protein [Bacillota bacterium]|nr:RHS repeat-associated core domain-containing protein [Bacillota bacterium]
MDDTTTNYTYNNANQLTAKGTRAFTYDAQGNEITDGTKTLGYNFDNQLKTYANGTTTTSYIYDATGNRIEKNGSTNYQYVNTGNNNVLVAKNITGNTSNFYVYGLDQISQGGPNTTDRQYYLTDGLGNVRYLTSGTGTTLNTYATDTYGSNQTTTGTASNNYIYQDEQKDSESGLTYLRARYYDPTTGRFTSQDPLSGTLENPASQNGYNYANNDPVNLSDPSGMSSLTLISAPTAIYNSRAIKLFEDYIGITNIKK